LHFVTFAAYSVQDIAVFGAGAAGEVFRDIAAQTEKHVKNSGAAVYRVHSKLKGQNSRTFQGLLKDLKMQFSSTKSIHKKTYHTRATSKFRVKYIL